jgi:hypothetical protein
MAEPTEGDEIAVVDDDGVEHAVDESEAVQLLSQWHAEDELAKGNVDPYLRNLAREGQGDATRQFFDRTLHELGYDRLAEAAQAEADAETSEPGEPGQP